MDSITTAWRRFHTLPRRWRWPLKTGVVLVVVLLTLYPAVWLLPIQLRRLRNPNALLDPDHPGLAALEEQARAAAAGETTTRALRQAVEQTVYKAVPYAWDWDTWGVMDYFPTVDEVLRKGREDCDGRAILAASLLRRMGQPAWLASDLEHMWVVTPEQELMSPGRGPKTLVMDDRGVQTNVNWDALRNLARAFSYGIAVFPLGRELIILGTICIAALHPWSSRARRVAGCALLLIALLMLRAHGNARAGWVAVPQVAWMAGLLGVTGWLVLVLRVGGSRSQPPPPQ